MYITPLHPETQGSLQKRTWKECKSQRVGDYKERCVLHIKAAAHMKLRRLHKTSASPT